MMTPKVSGSRPASMARALDQSEVSLFQRSRIQLMQKPTRQLHSAGIHKKLMIVSTVLATMIDELAPGRNQLVPLSDVWLRDAAEPSPGGYVGALIMDYAPTVDLERSRIMRTEKPRVGKTSLRLSATYPQQRVVRIETAAGRQIWADEATGTIFCSSLFRRRARALEGHLGLDFGICTEI